jgi:hypothetical protein
VSDIFASTDAVYRNFQGQLIRRWVPDEALDNYVDALYELRRRLGDALGDPIVRPVVGWFKRLAYTLARTPIEFEHAIQHCVIRPPGFERMIEEVGIGYPDAADAIARIRAAADELPSSDAQLLHDVARALSESFDAEESSAVVIGERRYIGCVRDVLRLTRHPLAQVVVASDLARLITFDRMLVCGPVSWYPAWLRTSPRAPRIYVLTHPSFSDPVEAPIAFPANTPQAAAPTPDWISSPRPPRRGPAMAVHELEPRLTTADLVAQVRARGDGESEELAVLALLEDQYAVFLPSDDASRVLTIDVAEGLLRIESRSPRELREGMFVVLRTKGGADYVRDVADQIMGPRARPARQLQEVWKSRLLARTTELGLTTTSARLREHGVSHASPANVERWYSARGIALDEKADFKALLGWLGLGEEVERMWRNVEELRSAHRRAGAEIRDLLVAELTRLGADALEGRSRMDITLSAPGAGALTAFRLAALSPGVHRVPAGQLGKAFEARD